MKNLIISICFLVSVKSVAQYKELIVKSGETVTIGAANQTNDVVTIKHLIMEDNSTIVVQENLESIVIKVKKSTVGSNTKILSSRAKDGVNGSNTGGQARGGGRCRGGTTGAVGGNATSGTPATDITLDICFISLGNLIIESRGGKGGNGGKGQTGGNGGRGSCSNGCGGGPGASGGTGGAAGNGGDSGDVFVYYRYKDKKDSSPPNVTIINNGGIAGNPGPGGNPGAGGGGVNNCGPWPHWSHGGGPGGRSGASGQSGTNGNDGKSDLIFGKYKG